MDSLPINLQAVIEELLAESEQISPERQSILLKLAKYIAERRGYGDASLMAICTHNSRRSHIAQLWLQVGAMWCGIDHVKTFSGGTEATAFNERAVAALRKIGFHLKKTGEGNNPVYEANYIGLKEDNRLFSKIYNAAPNPSQDFAAIMVCDDAEKACPFVQGADARFAIFYTDPKASDDTPEEAAAYDKKVREIGREMLFAMFMSCNL